MAVHPRTIRRPVLWLSNNECGIAVAQTVDNQLNRDPSIQREFFYVFSGA